MRLHFKLLFLLSPLFSRFVLGDLVNRTIDDQFGDSVTGNLVQYSPSGFWAQGNDCAACSAKPSNLSAYDGTWHDGSRAPDRDIEPLAFTLTFNGTAIYVFTIAADLTLTDVNFTLDGTQIGRYTEFYNMSESFAYNNSILSLNNIPYGEHSLTVDAFGPNQTLVLFDYALYTTNTSINDSPTPTGSSPGSLITASLNSSKTTHNTNVGAIAGGVVGGSVFLVLVGLFVVCCYRRRRHIAPEVTPFHPTRSTPIKEPPAQNIDHSDLKVLPTPSMSEEPPTTLYMVPEDLSSLIPRSSSESSRLREQLANLHAERDALRDRKSSSQLSPSHPSPSLPPSTGTPQTTEEIALLREEVAQLRARQDRDRGRDPSWASPVNQGLMLEVMALREELEEMRAQQELPRYSPPPPPFP